MSGNNIVQKVLGDLMEGRINKVAWNKAQEDQVYVKSEKEFSIAFDLLIKSLTNDEQQRLLGNFEHAWNSLEGLMYEYIYRQGIKDSQMIHKELSELGISVKKESMCELETI